MKIRNMKMQVTEIWGKRKKRRGLGKERKGNGAIPFPPFANNMRYFVQLILLI